MLIASIQCREKDEEKQNYNQDVNCEACGSLGLVSPLALPLALPLTHACTAAHGCTHTNGDILAPNLAPRSI